MATKTKPTVPSVPNVAVVQFFREVRTELAKVIWPTREDTVKLTLLVVTVSVMVGLFIGGLDILLIRVTGAIF